ncbi:unnamed protein product [Peronospora destructor]|uniref:Uncharacterized protein n=1 Tax=Peronospora destructor TaxID=86335 RepID=A0AAV0V7K6_9STRA|nr:unnamed protein product [Peronospora destructor]
MHLSQFCLLVTLTFIACCTAYASTEDLIQDKNLRTKSQRKLKENIDEVADEERFSPFNFVKGAKKKVRAALEDMKGGLLSSMGLKEKSQLDKFMAKLKALFNGK